MGGEAMMDKSIEIRPGDVFASRNPQGLGSAILLAQKLKSMDGEATYGHTGFLMDVAGTTFEALWTIKSQSLWGAYKGSQVLIARWNGMDLTHYCRGYAAVCDQRGRTYPFYRLLLHLIGLPKIHVDGQEVCSELTAHFLVAAGAPIMSGKRWAGVTPDYLVDEWRISKHFDVIFEGTL
jgi:hypothetical protein